MEKSETKTFATYPLRMSENLKTWLRGRAKRNDRSINAELNRILKTAKEQEETTQTEDTK